MGVGEVLKILCWVVEAIIVQPICSVGFATRKTLQTCFTF